METKDIKAVYFIGAGGIGMSAVARYFISRGLVVGGYDKTCTELTRRLEKEGVLMHYEENVAEIPHTCKNPGHTLVVYTPAIPASHKELQYFRENGFEIQKRAQVLGMVTRQLRGLCVAGTHGKTTTSTMCAHIMHQSHLDCNAFLGGIAKNYGTNYILSPQSEYVVIEADEYDRSFHCLHPYMSVITSTDPDHLDIYGTKEAYLESFRHYTELIQPEGALIIHRGLEMKENLQPGVRRYDYSRDEGDFHAENIRIENGEITFDFISPIECVKNVELGQPVPINIENGVAAMAMAQLAGCTADELRVGMLSFSGVDRRFDFKIKTPELVFLSDYAHHPQEINQSARSIRQLYQGRHITAIFQPHLYTRTRDFYQEFADALSQLDEVILTDIYPAREEPIEGVTSRLIYDRLAPSVEKQLITIDDVIPLVKSRSFDVLIVLGAGDLDALVPQMTNIFKRKIGYSTVR
ncbi:MAG: UDP-N-acetylmuramate--L-alanine ligase [Prevotella sp.]|nr:UDP-N-acetylmuramate--L-alanine ligase [Prevotella sp.]